MKTVVTLIILLLIGTIGATGYFAADHLRSAKRTAEGLTGGDVERGHAAIDRYGCTACHDIPGFAGTSANVGPSLSKVGGRMYIAGAGENTPKVLMHFLRDPRSVVQHGAMPNLHVTDQDARDIAAYLYTLQ